LDSNKLNVLVVSREQAAALELSTKTNLPIVFLKRMKHLFFLPDSVRVALYVNNNGKNFQLLTNPTINHVLLLHGESDKASSANKTSRSYDKIFVAGQAAVDRYAEAGVKIHPEVFEVIGRPQVEKIIKEKSDQSNFTIFYAPTFEGH